MNLAARSPIALALAAALFIVGAHARTAASGQETWTLEIPIDSDAEPADCPFDPAEVGAGPEAIFQYMQEGPAEASACAAFLDRHFPGWQSSDGAAVLVAPFVAYLLGDGRAKGMQRHAIFVNLLGYLEDIAPDWRLRPAVREMAPRIILGSVVEDPFVANFWTSVLDEMESDWRHSELAESALPGLYQLAVTEQQKPLSQRNVRPRELLKQLSWPEYGRLLWETEVFSSWPRRLLWILIAIALLGLAGRHFLRRPKKKAPQ